jgi:hypothetical protein
LGTLLFEIGDMVFQNLVQTFLPCSIYLRMELRLEYDILPQQGY